MPEKTLKPVTLAETTLLKDCANCGNELSGPYCSNCGQKKIDAKDASVLAFFENLFHIITHIDSKISRSFGNLIFRPGVLTEKYILGQRKKYMSPGQLFIVVSLIYFVLVGFFEWHTFTTPLSSQLTNGIYGDFISKMVTASVAKNNISFEYFEIQFNHALKAQAKMLVFVMIPIFALVLRLLYFRQKRYFVEHLVFSLHMYCFVLLALGLCLNLVFLTGIKLINLFGSNVSFSHYDSLIGTIAAAVLFVFQLVSLKRVYQETWPTTILKVGITFAAFWAIIILYRFLLFITVFYTLSIH